MRRDPLAARRLLVVAPHPDDETIGAWALIRRLGRAGARIDVIVVSDGGASHPGSKRWPRARLVRTRRRETLRAMAALAVPPSRVRFLGLSDGALAAAAARLRRLLARLACRCAADLIVGPAPDDAHADHRAVAEAIARLPRRGERRLGYRVWPISRTHAPHGPRIALDGGARAAKRRAVLSYRTQTGIITDATAGFAMTPAHLRAFVRPAERFAVLA